MASDLYANLTSAIYIAATNFTDSAIAKNAFDPSKTRQCLNEFAQGFALTLANQSTVQVTGNFEIRQKARAAVSCLGLESSAAQQAFEKQLSSTIVDVLLKAGINAPKGALEAAIDSIVSDRLAICWENARTGGGKKPQGVGESSGFAQFGAIRLNGSKIIVGCSEEKIKQLARECLKQLPPGQKTGQVSACQQIADCATIGGDFLVESNAETDTTCPALGQLATDTIDFLSSRNLLPQQKSDSTSTFPMYAVWILIGVALLFIVLIAVYFISRSIAGKKQKQQRQWQQQFRYSSSE